MAKRWKRQEARLIRPFSQTTRLQDCLKGTRFRLRETDTPSEEEVWLLSDLSTDLIAPVVYVALDRGSFENLPRVAMGDFLLLITIDDHKLLKSEVLYSASVDQVTTDPVAISDEVVRRFSWQGKVDIVVSVVMKADRKAYPGLPFLRGHWVAKKRFSIGPESEGRSFPLKPVQGKYFTERWNLPSDTVIYTEVVGDLDGPMDEATSSIHVFIHEDVHGVLLGSENQVPARLLMRFLAAEINAQALEQALAAFDGDTPTEGSLLSALATRIQKATNVDFKRLHSLARSSDGTSHAAELRAITQAAGELRRFVVNCDFKGQ